MITPASTFFNEEIRAEHLVTDEAKKLWVAQLELLQIFIQICKKHNLKYTLYAGSMLGAARHKGYIPWDDDVDVAMLREDYDVFLKVASEELPSNIFLQTSVSDPTWPLSGYAKLRNSNTAAIQKFYIDNKAIINQGIYIDIFPLDYIYSDKNKRDKIYKKYRTRNKILSYSVRNRFQEKENAKGKKSVFSFLFFILDFIIKCLFKSIVFFNGGYENYCYKTENVFRQLNEKKCDSVCDCTFCALANPNAKVYDKNWFTNCEYITVPFEYITAEIPAKFNDILERKYGNWHTMIKAKSYHEFIEVSTEMGYKELLVKKYGYQENDFK